MNQELSFFPVAGGEAGRGGASRLRDCGTRADLGHPAVAFMFPGEGAQYVGMGRALHRQEPVFRAEIALCSEILAPLIGMDLQCLLYPDGPSPIRREDLAQAHLAQPALFAVEYAVAQQWMAWGVRPRSLIGHGIGELVAATLADVFSLEDALMLVAQRGRAMQALPRGAMLAVRACAADLTRYLSPSLWIAAWDAPRACVLSGSLPAIETLQRTLVADGIACQRLPGSHAFHTPMMEPAVAPLLRTLQGLELSPPRLPMVSTVTGRWLREEDATAAAYWAQQLCAPVRFAEGLATLAAYASLLLETGPGCTLTARALHAVGSPLRAVASLPGGDEGELCGSSMRTALALLWSLGAGPDWCGTPAAPGRLVQPLKRVSAHPVDGASIGPSEPRA